MGKEEEYGYVVRCKNCRQITREVMIPMGDTVNEFLMTYEKRCPKCGNFKWEGVEAI